MEWLEAALAFAVVMMAFSTVVTAILELIHRIFNLRESGLRRIIELVYENYISKRLVETLAAQGTAQADFVDRMAQTRFKPAQDRAHWMYRLTPSLLNAGRLTQLTTLEFIERLAEMPEGRILFEKSRQMGSAYLEDFLHDLASKYEAVGDSASDYFTRRSRASTMVISVLLALIVNLNAIALFDVLVTDKELREDWIKRGEETAELLQKKQQELELLLQAPAQTGGKEQVAKIESNIREIRDLVGQDKSKGVPMGWDLFPWHGEDWKKNDFLDRVWLSVTWMFGVLLAGLLIGLGSPFWFDAFRKLTAITGLARGLLTPVQKQKEPGQQPPAEPTGVKSDLVKVFVTAAKADAMGLGGGRALLTPEGNIDKGELG